MPVEKMKGRRPRPLPRPAPGARAASPAARLKAGSPLGALALALAPLVDACGVLPSGGAGGAGGAAGAEAYASASASASAVSSGLVEQLAPPPLEPGAPPGALLPSPSGGPWLHCHDHFRPESTPLRDVTRLGMLCGHVNGMRAVGPVEEGEIVEGGEAKAHAFALKGGECVRVVAVADAPVEGLSVALADARGVLASATPGARWAIALADRPLCVAADGEYLMQVRSRKGSGRYAAQAWRLP